MTKLKIKFYRCILSILTTLIIFYPSNIALAQSERPNIIGSSAITVDLETGEIIYAKDIDSQRYPASITKLMTALIFAENASKTDKIPFTQSASIQPEYSLSANYGPITIGDSLSGDDTMKALLLFSANDAAYMIADYVAGNNTNFMKLMNEKATELGLSNTNFTNPNGLHEENHYTTAYDLAKIGKAVLENPWVKETIATKNAQIQFIDSQKRINIENRNKLLGENGNIGGKTGFTNAAGRCLWSVYERNGRTILGIVLNSEYGATDTQVFTDMNSIIDYSFLQSKLKYKEKGSEIAIVEAKYKPFIFFGKEKNINIPIILNEDLLKYDNGLDSNNISLTIDSNNMSAWKLAGNTNLNVVFTEKDLSTNILASSSISNIQIIKENILYYFIRITSACSILILIFWFIMTIKNKRIRRKNFLKRKKNIFK
ncbi:MAG: D-alanyl-D-alanine carboxypeptidase family protein [Sarcina sp.]